MGKNGRFVVEPSPKEREDLDALIRKGKAAARRITRARVLLLVDQGPEGPA